MSDPEESNGLTQERVHVPALSENEALRLLSLQVDKSPGMPDRVHRICRAMDSFGSVIVSYDKDGHGWAVIVMDGAVPKIVYSQAVDGD